MSKTEEQEQRKLKPNKCVTILALLATIAAAVAAISSAYTAFKAQTYIEKLNRSKILLLDNKHVKGKKQEGSVIVEFEYVFKIVGQEPIEIINMKIGNYNVKTRQFTVVQDHYRLVNKQFPENTFRHSVGLTVPVSALPDDIVLEKITNWIGAQLIVFNIRYRSGKNEEAEVKYYSIFRSSALSPISDSGLYQLSGKEYNEIEVFLPEEFRL